MEREHRERGEELGGEEELLLTQPNKAEQQR